MPLLTITNSTTHEVTVQDPTGLYGVSFTVTGSGSVANKHISDAALAALEPSLNVLQTAGTITWSSVNDPAFQSDEPPKHIVTVTVTPYNAVPNDRFILTNLTIAGAVSVVLSASAPVGQLVEVVDVKGDAGAHNITVTVASSGTINGGANTVISSNNGHVSLLKTGANAWVLV